MPDRALLYPLLVSCCVSLGACDRGDGEPEAPPPAPAAPSCPGADTLEQTWTPERRAELEQRLSELPGEWPMQLLETVDTRVQTRGASWRAAYVDACEAEDEAAQRCLERSAWRLDAALALADGDPSWAERLWPELDAVLGDVSRCGALEGEAPPALTPELARAWTSLGFERRYLANHAREQALTARLAQLDASLRDTPLYAFELDAAEATLPGADAKLDELAALGASLGPAAQLEVLQLRAALSGEAAAAEAALAAARELGEPWGLIASLHALGRAQLRARAHEAAVAPLAEAIALASRVAGAESPRVAEVQLTLAKVLTATGKIEAAYDLLTQARDSFIVELGPDHPVTLASVEVIGALFIAADQPGDAQYAYLDLLDVYDELYGPKHWRVARVKLELGDALMAMEQFDGARSMYMEALTPLVQEFGADSRPVVRTSIHLGAAQLQLGDLDEADKHCGRGINLVKALPPDDPLLPEAQACVDAVAAARKKSKRRKR